MRWTAKPYQIDAALFGIQRDSAGLLLPPGMGKTSITYAVMNALFTAKQIKGVLLIAPIRPLDITWPAERNKWDEFRGINLISLRSGPVQRVVTLTSKPLSNPVYLINPELTEWVCDWIATTPKAKLPFDMIVLDESTKFKNPGSKRFKALRKVLPRFARRIILTGTPAPNGLLDLWSQVYVLDNGHRLGAYITHYHRAYFDDVAPKYADYSEWRPKLGAQEVIENKIRDVCMSLRAVDHLKMPPLTINDVPVQLPPAARKVYNSMERHYVAAMTDSTVSATQAASARIKCRQIASGAVYDDMGKAEDVHTAKLEALSDLVEELSGDPVLVSVAFLHEVEAIRRYLKLPNLPYLGGGVTKKAADAIVTDWNDGKLPIVLAHPTSIAHGLNLQAGGSTVIWFNLTDNREEYDQLNARVYRQGQEKPVVIHRLIAENTVDVDIVASLESKDKVQTALLTALKSRISHGTEAKPGTAAKRRR